MTINDKTESRNRQFSVSRYISIYNPIIKYVRHGRKPYGVLIAEKIDGQVWFGWSLCNKKDRFNKKEGLFYAIQRMNFQRCEGVTEEMPRCIEKWFERFYDRVHRYFKV